MKDNYTTLQNLLEAYNQHIENSHICLVEAMPTVNVETPLIIIDSDRNKNLTLSNELVTFDTILPVSDFSSELPDEVIIGISKTCAYVMHIRSEASEHSTSWYIEKCNSEVLLTENTIQILDGVPSGDEIGCLPNVKFLNGQNFSIVKLF